MPSAIRSPKCLPPSSTSALPLIHDSVNILLDPASSYISLSLRSPLILSDVLAIIESISDPHPYSVPSADFFVALFVSTLLTANLTCLMPLPVC